MVVQGFLTQPDRDKTLFSADLGEIGAFIADYTPPEVRKYEVQAVWLSLKFAKIFPNKSACIILSQAG